MKLLHDIGIQDHLHEHTVEIAIYANFVMSILAKVTKIVMSNYVLLYACSFPRISFCLLIKIHCDRIAKLKPPYWQCRERPQRVINQTVLAVILPL
jgi:hypothetical protein